MEYMPIDEIFSKNENRSDILKRTNDQITPNGDELLILSNKRNCAEEEKVYLNDSLQSLEVHTDAEWSFINNDFEHAVSSKSQTSIRTQRIKPMPIIFHFASEDSMDIEEYGMNSIYSAGTLPLLSGHDFRTILTQDLSQTETKREQSTIAKPICSYKFPLMMINESDKECNTSLRSEIISSHPIDTTLVKSSSLSSADTSLDRSLERLQANYRQYLARRKTVTKSNIHQSQDITIDSQAYIRCRKHRQSIPVEIIPSDIGAKLFQHSISYRKNSRLFNLSSKNRN